MTKKYLVVVADDNLKEHPVTKFFRQSEEFEKVVDVESTKTPRGLPTGTDYKLYLTGSSWPVFNLAQKYIDKGIEVEVLFSGLVEYNGISGQKETIQRLLNELHPDVIKLESEQTIIKEAKEKRIKDAVLDYLPLRFDNNFEIIDSDKVKITDSNGTEIYISVNSDETFSVEGIYKQYIKDVEARTYQSHGNFVATTLNDFDVEKENLALVIQTIINRFNDYKITHSEVLDFTPGSVLENLPRGGFFANLFLNRYPNTETLVNTLKQFATEYEFDVKIRPIIKTKSLVNVILIDKKGNSVNFVVNLDNLAVNEVSTLQFATQVVDTTGFEAVYSYQDLKIGVDTRDTPVLSHIDTKTFQKYSTKVIDTKFDEEFLDKLHYTNTLKESVLDIFA